MNKKFNKKSKFHTYPYINIEISSFIFNMRVLFKYYWSHTYNKFHNFYMHKTSYTFILIFKHLFFTVYTRREFYGNFYHT